MHAYPNLGLKWPGRVTAISRLCGGGRMSVATETDALSRPPAERGYPNRGYAWYVVGVLTFVYVFSFLDRIILNLLVGPIRRDLNITDTQMSLLIGFSFALFYVGLGVPLGRVADSRSRRGLIASGFGLWSIFTGGCGLASNYLQLMLMRMGVGVGEASLGPAAFSLITDYFPPERRGAAMGIYHLGVYVGSGLAFLSGGLITVFVARQPEWNLPLLGNLHSWQVVFFIVGLTGLVSVPVMLTVREPVRPTGEALIKQVPFRDVWAYYRRNMDAYLFPHLGFALMALSGFALVAWLPSFFIRHHHWSAAQFGLLNGLSLGLGGSMATLSSGWLADRLTKAGWRDAFMRIAAIGSLLSALLFFGVFLAPNGTTSAVFLVLGGFFYATQTCLGPATIMQITPPKIRGQAGALYLLTLGLIGQGLGPTLVALVTDFYFRDDNQVGYSLLIVTTLASLIAALFLWFGRKEYVKAQERVSETSV
jgi:MFS family permease